MRNKTFRIVKCDLGSEGRAADVRAPAPGQGLRPDVFGSCGPNTPAAGPSIWLGAVCKTGWGGGRNSAGPVPAFDPHPSLPPARGKVQFPPASAPPTGRTIRFFANAAARRGCGMLMRNKAFWIVKFIQQIGGRPRTTGVGRPRKPRSPKIPSTRLWHSLNVPLPRALPGRSLAELGSLVPSKLPQGSLEPRDSPPSERGPPA